MYILFYITGLLTGLMTLYMLRYKSKYNSIKKENTVLKSQNAELSIFKKRWGFRRRDGIINKVLKRGTKKINFIIEITEIEKTTDKSKIIIDNITCLDADEDLNKLDYERITRLVGNWVSTADIEWNVDKTTGEKRNDAIDDILK